MDISTCIFALGLFAQTLFTTLSGVNAGIHHTVSWKICGYNQSFCRASDHGLNFLVGDTLEFRMDYIRNETARVVSESEYEACRVVEGSKAVNMKGGERIELNRSGFWYFISDRCESGEKVMISVRAKIQSSRMGRGGGSGGGSGGNGGMGNGGMGNGGGFNTPKGNRDHPNKKSSAGSLTRSTVIAVLLAFCSILINVC